MARNQQLQIESPAANSEPTLLSSIAGDFSFQGGQAMSDIENDVENVRELIAVLRATAAATKEISQKRKILKAMLGIMEVQAQTIEGGFGMSLIHHALNRAGYELRRVRAEFLGWQMGQNNEKIFPLFNVLGSHPLNQSTVGLETLQRFGIEVPVYQ